MSGKACPVLLAGKKPNKPKEVFYAYRVDDFSMDRRWNLYYKSESLTRKRLI